MKVMYPHLIAAAWKTESKQEDTSGKRVKVRLAQSEGKNEIMSLKQLILQL